MSKIKFATILLIVLSLACNVSLLQAKLIEKSSKKMPAWVGKNIEEKKSFYFSGSSTQDTFDKARQFAINDALTQVVQSLDLTMSINTNRIISDTGIFLDERTKSKTREVRLLNTKLKDIYFEKYEETGKFFFTVHVLVEYNKKEYEQEKARLAKEYELLKQNLVNRYTKAKQLINSKLFLQALPELIESLKVIYTYGINQTLEPEILSKINNILNDISFKNSFSSNSNHSGINAEILVYINQSKELCKNFSFAVKTLNNFSIENVSTNDEGKINYSFNKVSYLKKSNYKLELDLRKTFNIDEDFIKKYTFKTVSNELDFLGENKRIKLNISCSDKKEENLIKILTTSLVQNGFVVVKKDADYILDLKFNFIETTKTELKKMQSMDTELFISKANIIAELISCENQIQINSISSEEKGFGKTINQSYFDLLQKVSTSITNSL